MLRTSIAQEANFTRRTKRPNGNSVDTGETVRSRSNEDFMKFMKQKHFETGSVLIEAGLSIPLLILLIFGICELGRLLAQTTWALQSSYEAAMSGALSQVQSGSSAMNKRFNYFLVDIPQNHTIKNRVFQIKTRLNFFIVLLIISLFMLGYFHHV